MSRRKSAFTICWLLVFLCPSWGTSLNPLEGVEEGSKDFANHRVLRFYGLGKYGGERTLFINRARVIFQDRAHIFWIGSGSGLYTYDEKQNQWEDFREKQDPKAFRSVWRICQDRAGRIWLKTLSREIRFFDGQGWHSSSELAPPVSLPVDNSVMFTSRNGRLWFVTYSGLIAFDGQRWTSPAMPPKDIEEAYARVPLKYRNKEEEERELWAARIDQRLAQTNDPHPTKTTKKIKPTDVLLPTIYQGLQDRNGNIWLGARKAIIRFDPERNTWKMYPLQGIVEARLIYEDRQGRIWFADEEGHLAVYNQKLDNWKSYDLNIYFPQIQPKTIESIYQDKAGQIMIGISVGGLVLLNEQENRWRILHEENTDLPLYGVTSIVEDNKGRIWVGMSEGILVLEQ